MVRLQSACVVVLSLAASTVSAVAQDVVPAPSRPVFTQEAFRRAASSAMHDSALPDQATPQAAPSPAPGPNRSWDTLVDTVKKGKKVTVTLMTTATVEGKLVAIDARSIRIEQPGGAQTIETAEVFRVRYAGIRSRHARWGMLIGATAAAIAGAIIYRNPTIVQHSDGSTSTLDQQVEATVMYAIFLGLPGGAIGGALMPIGEPLYEAAAVVRKAP